MEQLQVVCRKLDERRRESISIECFKRGSCEFMWKLSIPPMAVRRIVSIMTTRTNTLA